VNLGFFKVGSTGQPGEALPDDAPDGGELTVAVQEIELVDLSDRGWRIARAYGAAVEVPAT
jgi:hypothetical protein